MVYPAGAIPVLVVVHHRVTPMEAAASAAERLQAGLVAEEAAGGTAAGATVTVAGWAAAAAAAASTTAAAAAPMPTRGLKPPWRPPKRRSRRPAPPPSDRRLRSFPPLRLSGGRADNQAHNRRRRPPRSARQAAARRLAAEAARTPPDSLATRVCASLDRWSQIGASPWVLRVLRFGYCIPWRRPPPPLRRKAYPQPSSDLAFGHKTADKWVSRGFVAELPPEEAAVAPDVSPTFFIHHPKDRLVVDLLAKNEFMEDRKFQYEMLTGYTTQLSPGDHLFSWDLQNAFFHIPLAPADQKRLAFRVGDRVFIPLVLPFGLKLAPFVLTKVLRPVVGYLQRLGIAVLAYMDDFCGRPPGKPPDPAEAATQTRVKVLELFRSLGLAVHPTKGEEVGTTKMPILGYVLDTSKREITLPDSRLAGLIAAAGALTSGACSASRRVSFKALQRFTGKAVSCSLALPAGRLYLQRLYAAQRGNSHRRSVRLTHGALRDLSWWRSLRSSSQVGRPLWRPCLGVSTTDASPYGWGGHWDDEVPAKGLFDEATRSLHINVKEVEAATLSLLALAPHCGISEGTVALRIDSTVALFCINIFSSRSPRLVAALRRLYAVAKRLSITISGTWVASVANLRADALS